MAVIQLDDVGLTFRVRRHGRISLKEYLLHGFYRRGSENSLKVRAGRNQPADRGRGAGRRHRLQRGRQEHALATARRRLSAHGRKTARSAGGSVRSSSCPWGSKWTPAAGTTSCTAAISRERLPLDPRKDAGDRRFQRTWPISRHAHPLLLLRHVGPPAFSIATAINPEVLLLDEVLAAGDASFQAKAVARMQGLILLRPRRRRRQP